MRVVLFLLAAVVATLSGPPSSAASARQAAQSAQDYDLLLKGGHVIDSRNNLSAADRKIQSASALAAGDKDRPTSKSLAS